VIVASAARGRRAGVRLALRWCVAVAVLAALLVWADPRAVGRVLGGVSVAALATLVALAAAWLVVGALNLRLLLGPDAPPPPTSLGVYLLGWLLSSLLPGQLGDAVQVPLLRRHGLSLARSGAAYAVDKAVSLAWSLAVATVGAVVYLPLLGSGRVVTFAAAAVLLAALGAALLLRLPLGGSRLAGRLHERRARLAAELGALAAKPAWIARDLALTVVRWLLTAAMYATAFAACGEPLPLLATATLPLLVSLVGYLPVSVGGIGVMEWAATGVFGVVGAAAAPVLAVYLLLRGVLLAVAGVGALALLGRALHGRG
jgi:uncharacterized membrane protein YbhN (UPF0104 family)